MHRSRKLSWLHLSDLHLRDGDQYDQSQTLGSLLTHLQEIGSTYDLIYITGDIVFSGTSSEYSVARDFIQKLSTACRVPPGRIFCIPGNHDVDRRELTPLVVHSAKALSSRELVSQVLGKSRDIAFLNTRLQNYYAFVRNLFPWAQNLSEERLSFTENLRIEDLTVSILGLNSAWLSSGDEDRGRLVIGERQVREALAKTTSSADLMIALLHHPLAYLADFDAADVQSLLNRRCDFVLHGHLHDFGAVKVTSPDSEVFYFAAGATYQGRREILAYNSVEVDLETGSARVSLYRYSDREGGFWAPDTQMYQSAPRGVLDLRLPERISHVAQSASEQIEPLVAEAPREKAASSFEPVAPAPPLWPVDPILDPISRLEPKAPEPPPSLVETIRKGQCVLFVGAGASIDAKLPTWSEMVRDLVDRVIEAGTMRSSEAEDVQRLIERDELLILSAYCRERLGPYEFAEYLKNRLAVSGRTSRTHRLLASIPFRAAVTTNFDTFTERSRTGSRVILPDAMEKIGAAGLEELLRDSSMYPVVKMHGSVEDVDSIALTQGDFRKLLFKQPKYREFLRRLFTDSTIFFYGYSFRDPNVDFVLQEIMAAYEGKTRPHYALLPDPGLITQEYWLDNFNIRIIPYPLLDGSHLAAVAFLERLAELTAR